MLVQWVPAKRSVLSTLFHTRGNQTARQALTLVCCAQYVLSLSERDV